jgi:hypothetical protein
VARWIPCVRTAAPSNVTSAMLSLVATDASIEMASDIVSMECAVDCRCAVRPIEGGRGQEAKARQRDRAGGAYCWHPFATGSFLPFATGSVLPNTSTSPPLRMLRPKDWRPWSTTTLEHAREHQRQR